MTGPKKLTAILLCAGLFSCASEKPAPAASNAAKNYAMSRYAECVEAAAQKLDDGVSNPTLIALGIGSVCDEQFALYAKIGAQGMSRSAVAAHQKVLELTKLETTTGIVINMRTQKRRQISN